MRKTDTTDRADVAKRAGRSECDEGSAQGGKVEARLGNGSAERRARTGVEHGDVVGQGELFGQTFERTGRVKDFGLILVTLWRSSALFQL